MSNYRPGNTGSVKRWALRQNMSIRENARRTGLARYIVKNYFAARVEELPYVKLANQGKLDPNVDVFLI